MDILPPVKPPNTLGNASLALGIASASLVFGIAVCALTAANQWWLRLGATPLFVCGASSAFLGLLAIALGAAGLLGANRSRSTAIVGIVLGVIGICLFLAAAGQAATIGG
jgi:cytochrome c biogenesis protein CcdA